MRFRIIIAALACLLFCQCEQNAKDANAISGITRKKIQVNNTAIVSVYEIDSCEYVG